MTQRVIDLLESVEVNVEQRGLKSALPELKHFFLERILKLVAIRQICQIVEMGHALDLAQSPLLKRHVLDDGDEGSRFGALAVEFEEAFAKFVREDVRARHRDVPLPSLDEDFTFLRRQPDALADGMRKRFELDRRRRRHDAEEIEDAPIHDRDRQIGVSHA